MGNCNAVRLEKAALTPTPLPQGEGLKPPSPCGRRAGDEGHEADISNENSLANCIVANWLKALRAVAITFAMAALMMAATTQDAALEARVTHLSERLRCLVCQNQSIAESTADLANDLRRQVREMLAAGKSDNEILDYMVERYGDFVLYDPPFQLTTLLLWGGPASLMLLALGGFAWTVRLRRKEGAPRELSEEDKARARTLLDNTNNEISA